MRVVGLVKSVLWLVVLGFAGMLAWGYARQHPEDMPWGALSLGDPPGAFTGRKLAGLTDEGSRCRALLGRAGVRFVAIAPVSVGTSAGRCGYADGVRFAGGGSRTIAFAPAGVGTSCAVAAGLTLWEWHVVQPAAQRHFGSAVARIDHLGSYNCRRIGGGSGGDYSEHSTADAIDVAAFRLADGRRVSVIADWTGSGPEAAFLREVRDGACDLFSTVLSPDYNAAHRDHFHLDQAERGATGWRGCR